MRVTISRFVVVAAAAALMIIVATPLLAQAIPNFQPSQGFSQSQICPLSGCLITVNGGTLDDLGPGIINPSGWTPNVPSDTTVLELTQNEANQRGSAWFNTAQPVTQAWSSTFQFRLTSGGTGDGFAFVIQNNGEGSLSAIGGFGGGLGYGTRCQDNVTPCTPAGSDPGIPNSLAIEFDTFQNYYDPDNHHIAVQSCGSSPNSPDHMDTNPTCEIAIASIPTNIVDGNPHTVRIDYALPSCSDNECGNNLLVYIDGTLVLTAAVDINSILGLDSSNAYIGFTAATRGATEAHDILSWTFTPSQTQPVTTGGTTVYNFQGGVAAGGYDYSVQLNSGSSVNVQVTPKLMSQTDCNALVQKNSSFNGAQCFAYHNADGMNGDFAVMFEVVCPDSPDNDQCGTSSNPNFDAELGSDYNFVKSANPGFRQNPQNNPFPGWLKGHALDNAHPCTPNPDNSTPLFQSNQIDSFIQVGDPTGTTKGGSGGTGSCWVATYNTPSEVPGVNIITPANGVNYPQGANIASNFSCSTVNTNLPPTVPTPPVGPYLTVPTTPAPGGCTAKMDSGSPITSGTPITTTVGTHAFTATVTDSGLDTASQTVSYNVVGPADLAILKLAPFLTRVNSKLTYAIGVVDFGPANAVDVKVADLLPANTSLVSVSAKKVSCSIVNHKLTCSTTTIPCTNSSPVSCTVGTLLPFSLSSLNGATINLTVQLGSAWIAGNTIKNTATVSGSNTDPHPGNNSSSASTLVTSH